MRVAYYFQEILTGAKLGRDFCVICIRKDFINNEARKCDLCDKSIEPGEDVALLINDDWSPREFGEKYYLHKQCADNSTISYEEYLEQIRDYFY